MYKRLVWFVIYKAWQAALRASKGLPSSCYLEAIKAFDNKMALSWIITFDFLSESKEGDKYWQMNMDDIFVRLKICSILTV